jgi:hypothetical protein
VILSVRTISALALVAGLVGCYPPTQTGYNPAVVEQPQPVHFFYGELVDVRPASLEYGYEAGIGATARLSPWLAGLHFGGNGPSGGARFSAGFVDVLVGGSVPNLPATEYTVMLNTGTNPPDPFLDSSQRTAAIIVVQNDLPERYPTDFGMQKGEPVVVRVVGRSGRVMRNPLTPNATAHLAAVAPMPVPLAGAAVAYAAPAPQGRVELFPVTIYNPYRPAFTVR